MSHNHATLLSDVHRELLGGDAVFPTSVHLAVAIRQALDQDEVSINEVARMIAADPLLAAKLVRLANCVTFNPGGQTIFDIGPAVSRVGFNAVRAVSMALVLSQLKTVPLMAPFVPVADETWKRSVQISAMSRLLARTQRGVNPDEAMLCGLVADIGVFYLLPRAGAHAEYVANPSLLADLLQSHAASVSTQFLTVLGLPGNIVQAVSGAALPDIHPARPLRQILSEARRLVDLPQPLPEDEPQTEWLLSVQTQFQELTQALQV